MLKDFNFHNKSGFLKLKYLLITLPLFLAIFLLIYSQRNAISKLKFQHFGKAENTISSPFKGLAGTKEVNENPEKEQISNRPRLGNEADKIAEILNWTIILCEDNVKQEDIEKGIFLYDKENNEYFCDFGGYESKSNDSTPDTEFQYMLVLKEISNMEELKPNGLYFLVEGYSKLDDIDFSQPTFDAQTLSQKRLENKYSIDIKRWPLSKDQFLKIYNEWK